MAFDESVLSGLSSVSLEALHAHGELVALTAGRALYRVGVPIRDVYFLTHGQVSLLALTPDGATLELAAVGAGGFLGLPVVLGTGVAMYLATVHVAGGAWRLSAETFLRVLHDHPGLREACLRYADRALSEIGQTAVCHSFHPVSGRLCRWLLETSARLQSDTIPMTHERLSAVLGVRRAGITEALSELQRAEAVRVRPGQIVITHRRRLELSACACYDRSRDVFELTPPPNPSHAALRRRLA
jgi:CRP-like cAMP-binding protein